MLEPMRRLFHVEHATLAQLQRNSESDAARRHSPESVWYDTTSHLRPIGTWLVLTVLSIRCLRPRFT